MSRILAVYNPRCRKGGKFFSIMQRWIQANGLSGDVDFAEITDLEDTVLPEERLVVAGGDGTINSTLEWLYARGGECPVGLLPAGTANCLAAGFGLPKDPSRLCKIAFSGTDQRPLDILTYRIPAEERPRLILQSSTLGFPTNIGVTFERLRQNCFYRMSFRLLGSFSYKLLAMYEIWAQRKRGRRGEPVLNVKVTFPPGEDQPDFKDDVLAMFINNERTIGGNLVPCPRALVDDGLMDICIFRAATGHSYLKLLSKLGNGRHIEEEDVVIYQQSRGPVQVSLSFSQPFNADGDIWVESAEYEFALEPGRFEIFVAE